MMNIWGPILFPPPIPPMFYSPPPIFPLHHNHHFSSIPFLNHHPTPPPPIRLLQPAVKPNPTTSPECFSFHPTVEDPADQEEDPPIPDGASFPVFFFNGRKELVDAGDIFLRPSLDYKEFKTQICIMIGIAPRLVSTFLVRPGRADGSQPLIFSSKILIDESSDFAAISLERHCYVLATLTRFQRWTQPRVIHQSRGAGTTEAIPPVITSILKRSPEGSSPDEAASCQDNYHEGWQSKTYLTTNDPANKATFAERVKDAVAVWSLELCEICLTAEEDGRSPDIHTCIYHETFSGFNTPKGPIERPSIDVF